jgi:hypothetical protein
MESGVELHERMGRIKSKEDLADFVSALKLDLEAHPLEWENPTLGRFLDAMERWIASMDSYYKNTGQPSVEIPTWRTFADILLASKMYE